MDPVKAKANFSRVCQLLIDKGGDALRRALHVKHPPATLAAALNANRKTLQKIRYSVIKLPQWKLLYPVAGAPDSNSFDITLLTILLRNICGLASPTKGWDVMPPASDTSISANIVRIKMFRNDVYGHISSSQYDDTTFETLWQEISKPLVKLGISQQDIDELKEAPLSSEEESYIEKLKEWKELEDDLLAKLINVERKVAMLQKSFETENMNNIKRLAKFDFTGKIDSLSKKFQDGTRGWFFEKLSSWFSNEESSVMILTAGPGVGKSVLSAKACELYKQCGNLVAYHFCDYRNSDYSNPHRILQSLASQMCDNVVGFRDKLTDGFRREHSREALSDAFRVLLNDPLHALGKRDPMLIVVDALDESKTDVKSEFLELISDEFSELPKWIKILISSRPELQVRTKLQHFNPLEIRPDDQDHNLDLEHFIGNSLPNLNRNNVTSLVSKCEGSFLYAYYLVEELKEVHLGIEPNITDFAQKGIAGFYEKQFKRLKTGLRRFKPGILKSFANVIAACRAPLPIKILLTCMDLPGEIFEIRKAIIDIMSEFLPVYEDCLTVYHKSLTDWLTLDGFEEHEFDVADGTKRLWHACRSIYSDIDSLKSVSDFRFSPKEKFALDNGAGYLVNVGETDDFHWLVHVKLNFFKLKFCCDFNVDFDHVIRVYSSKLSDDLFHNLFNPLPVDGFDVKEKVHVYLQSLANGHFNFVQNSISCKNAARDILDETKEVWMEEVANANNTNYKIVSNAVFRKRIHSGCIASSPDYTLLACFDEQRIEVFKLPCLTLIFELEVNWTCRLFSEILTFSPDSSYFISNSIRSSVCIKEQKEVPFIPGGPERVDSCSFSSCGMKLVTLTDGCIHVWDVRKKVLLVEYQTQNRFDRCSFSTDNAFVLVSFRFIPGIDFWDFRKLERLDSNNICFDTCLTNNDNFQIISSPASYLNPGITTYHFHLPNGKMVLIINRSCSKPFSWRGRKCVLFSSFYPSVLYDFIKQEVVDTFRIDCLPCDTYIDSMLKLDETNFLICFNRNQAILLSFESNLAETSVAPFFNNTAVKCCTISADNLYVACCYENRILAIKSVGNGETLQTLVLKQSPKACWWSEGFLWMVCEGVVVKYPYNSTLTEVLGNYLEECSIRFYSVLKFAEGVLVIDDGNVSIWKIYNGKLCPQEIPNPYFRATSAEISSDGCAVLLYRLCYIGSYREVTEVSDIRYELCVWEEACENRWELIASKIFHAFEDVVDDPSYKRLEISGFFLAGTKNSRRPVWLNHFPRSSSQMQVYLLDFSDIMPYGEELSIPKSLTVREMIFLPPDFVIIHDDNCIHFTNVSDAKIIASLYLGYNRVRCEDGRIFYLASQGALLFLLKNDSQYFKIHNIKNHLK